MENQNAPVPRVCRDTEPRDITIRVERGELGEQAPAPLDPGQIHDDDKRDLVLVAGNLFSLLNSTIVLVYCLAEEHYALTHGLRFEIQPWQYGLMFGPIVGYNFLAWTLRSLKGR
jgi:hypothetical protein